MGSFLSGGGCPAMLPCVRRASRPVQPCALICRYAALCCHPDLGPKQAHAIVGTWRSLGALMAAYEDPARRAAPGPPASPGTAGRVGTCL